MIKAKLFLVFIYLVGINAASAQNIQKILINNQWSAFNNFAVIDFQENGKALIEYAYCSRCRANQAVLEWKVEDKLLILGTDSLMVTSATNNLVTTNQYQQTLEFKNLKKVKSNHLSKEEIHQFLVTEQPIKIELINKDVESSNSELIHFTDRGKMWIKGPNFKGQWALKAFYGDLFLIYINRYTINRDYPIIKLNQLKKNKLIAVPMPSIKKGVPFALQISK